MNETSYLNYEYLEFWTKDDFFGLRINITELQIILRYCEKSFPNETGGILIGNYTQSLDCALIETVVGPPEDSQFGRTWFRRGVKGMDKILKINWEQNLFYIGEWHFHPDGEPIPSYIDKNQLKSICMSKNYYCSAPILLIIGGKIPSNWKIKAFVFPRHSEIKELFTIG